jgi:micrococcal nuclease
LDRLLFAAVMVLVVLLALGCGESAAPDSTERAQPPPPRRGAPPAKSRGVRFPGPRGARPARVTGVSDGDTISLSDVGKVRLIGVDTPEVFGGPAECFGRAASAFTKRALPTGRRVRYRLGVEPRDRYGRALAYVWLADGRLFNGLLVERGYALPLTIAPNVELAERFQRAARAARRAGRGLWARGACVAGRGRRRERDCSDFRTQARAQRHFARRGGRRGRNVGGLDGDGDGRACESLP